MLFSNVNVSAVINNGFEPVWISVRDVPIVRIDFGNGKVITRTLHGNVATSVCTAEGEILDVMPGVYEPQTYQRRLGEFYMLHRWLKQPGENRLKKMKRYHNTQTVALTTGKQPHKVQYERPKPKAGKAAKPRLDVSKVARIEGPLKLVLKPAPNTDTSTTKAVAIPGLDSEKHRALWESLAEDTRANETIRRLKVHRYLAEQGTPQAKQIVKWLYREVLDADLDDPYFGLGDLLFATYPFAEEDRQ